MIERGLLMVIQLGWWQRLVYGRQGPIMVCTSASSSGVRDFLTFISLISLSSKAATTEQPYCLAQERLWFERPLGRALCTALQAPCRGLLAMRSPKDRIALATLVAGDPAVAGLALEQC